MRVYPNIEAELARRRWSKVEFSKRLGVSYKTVYNWLNGKTDLPASILKKMSQLLECSTDYLLGI